MPIAELKIAGFRYDNTRALFDGTVELDGVAATFHTAPIITEIFESMVRDQEYDVAELGWTFYLRTLDFDEPPFIALPIFPNRQFRHSAIYVNQASGIREPKDLADKTVGEFATYGHDAGFWPKGILSDHYDLTPDQCRWIIGRLDWPLAPIDFIPFLHPADVDVIRAPQGADLGQMLDDGEIDALISADVPKCVLDGSPRVGLLFPDYETVEREYFRDTGIYPAMHTVVVTRKFASEHPEVLRVIYDGYCRSKDVAAEQYRRGRVFNNMDHSMVPWFPWLLDRNQDLFGDDVFPHGVQANRVMVDTALRYHHEQGLSRHRLTCDDVFVAELLDT